MRAPVVFLLALCAAVRAGAGDGWAKSPEAAFLTPDERREWKRLRSDSARAEFQTAYWRRRDPTAATERNEFRETVLARIAAADERFTSGRRKGSRTARGVALVVLGPPAAERVTAGPIKPALVEVQPGRMGLNPEAFHSAEWHAWVYDRPASRELLDALGQPSLEVAFVVERGRSDQMPSFRQFAGWQERLSRRSIVNP